MSKILGFHAKSALVALTVLAAGQAHADLVGTSVTGALFPTGYTDGVYETSSNWNLFDPANGSVPPGYGNSSSTTVTIGSEIEFAYVYYQAGTVAVPDVDSVIADFTGSTLTIQAIQNYGGGITGGQAVFTDPGFAGLTVGKTLDTFANGGFSTSLVGDTLTLSYGPDCVLGSGCTNWGHSMTAAWSFSGSGAVPESSTWAMMALGFAGLGYVGFRRRSAVAAAL
jgi:hypothetical protein